MPKVLSFKEAVVDAEERCRELTILLGNGFSIDYAPDVFDYESLAGEAALAGLSVPKQDLFADVGSSNFEVVIDRLRVGASLNQLYGGKHSISDAMTNDAKVVRNGLADALADRHPSNALELSDDEVLHARTFLANFGRIFTLSYDLLLYWVINRRGIAQVTRRDGFEWPSMEDRTELIWKSNPYYRQTVFFLHGALHFYVENKRVHKLSYWADGPLVDGLRERLLEGRYPLVVTEGTREEKEARIDKSPYLRTGLRRFGETRGALFIHGASLSPNDGHVWELIEAESSQVEALYVGVRYPSNPGGRRLIELAQEVKQRREENGGSPLLLRFYKATSASVWRDPART